MQAVAKYCSGCAYLQVLGRSDWEVLISSIFPGQDGESETIAESTSFVHGELPPDGSGPPKVDSEVEVLHEKVTKQIIKEGHGQKPSKYSTCFCKSIMQLIFVLLWCYSMGVVTHTHAHE